MDSDFQLLLFCTDFIIALLCLTCGQGPGLEVGSRERPFGEGRIKAKGWAFVHLHGLVIGCRLLLGQGFLLWPKTVPQKELS